MDYLVINMIDYSLDVVGINKRIYFNYVEFNMVVLGNFGVISFFIIFDF